MKHSEIKEILNHMSIEEKVVQLCGVSGIDIVHLLENGTFSKKKCKEKKIKTGFVDYYLYNNLKNSLKF